MGRERRGKAHPILPRGKGEGEDLSEDGNLHLALKGRNIFCA